MARSAAPRPSAPDDQLKPLLDQLAKKSVQAVLVDPEATPRSMSDVLKVASGYWALSHKDDGDKEPSAWARYHKAMTTAPEGTDAKAH